MSTEFDYVKIREKYGLKKVDSEVINRLKKLTGGKIHHLLDRGLFFAHNDLERILDLCEKKEPFFMFYHRRPTTASLHLGHLATLLLIKWLQEELNIFLIIQITTIEFFYACDTSINGDKVEKQAIENIKQLIAIGFDKQKTFIFSDRDLLRKCPNYLINQVKIGGFLSFPSIVRELNFDGSNAIGAVDNSALRIASIMPSSYPFIFQDRANIPCLIITGIDDKPYLNLIEEMAPIMNYSKPSYLFATFVPALQGISTKQASIDTLGCIYLSDTSAQIKNKINKYAFSGGGETVEEHKEKGGNCDVDIAFQYLRYFLEDDKKLKEIHRTYSEGSLLTGFLKKDCIQLLQNVISPIQERIKNLTNEQLNEYLSIRQFDVLN